MLNPLSLESITEDISSVGSNFEASQIQTRLYSIVIELWKAHNNDQLLKNYYDLFGDDDIYQKMVISYNEMKNKKLEEEIFYFLCREEIRMIIHKFIKDDNEFNFKLTQEFAKEAIYEENDFHFDEDTFVLLGDLISNVSCILFIGSRFEVLYNLYVSSTKYKIYSYIKSWILSDIELYPTSYDIKCAIIKHLIELILSSGIDYKIKHENGRNNIESKIITPDLLQKSLDHDLKIVLNIY